MSDGFEPADMGAEIDRVEGLELTNADLLRELGAVDSAQYASPSDRQARGLRLLRNAVARVRDQLCEQKLFALEGRREVLLAVAAVFDFLGTKGAATAAVLIVNIGVRRVCEERWEADATRTA